MVWRFIEPRLSWTSCCINSMHVKMDSIVRNALLYRLKKTSRAWAPWVSLKVYKKLKFSFIFNTKLPLHKKTRLTNTLYGWWVGESHLLVKLPRMFLYRSLLHKLLLIHFPRSRRCHLTLTFFWHFLLKPDRSSSRFVAITGSWAGVLHKSVKFKVEDFRLG